MRILKSTRELDRFFLQLRQADKRALLLDYDGTLAPFQVERDTAIPYPGVRERLQAILAGKHTRLVVISGRQIADLIPLLGMDPLPELWGSHGWERLLPDQTYQGPCLETPHRCGLARARTWGEEQGWQDRYESKPASLALHWRGLPEEEITRLRQTVLEAWTPIARESGLVIHEFDGGVELRVPGQTKGDAVQTILAEMDTDAVVAYLGDDLTDEDAFQALGNHGLSVLVRPVFRPTAADVWIIPPTE
ncbi:MAG: trehalose-phosphatase, partial [Nitrospinota bacterium]